MPFNQPQWISMMFYNKRTMTENKRNNFTIRYYDSIISSTDRDNNWLEVSKYNTSLPHEAETIITYRQSTAKQYNDLMLKHYRNLN